ncbi:hypothetical protein [Flavipsychrobacter stenotrophus]|uniref:hypothetical protein n=1 Tax=Flavipsychrobacter stenotrophus TaxID=2077091 RepID=UPI001374DE4F|nr:hypothetical protein [Flavipsychrobacter stenotrophus]
MMPKVSDVYSNSVSFDDDAEGIGRLCKQLPLLCLLANSHRGVFVLYCTIESKKEEG